MYSSTHDNETAADTNSSEAIGLKPVFDKLNNIILGKEEAIRLAITCLLARGHLLIEDQPGVGKTTLAHALARILGLSYQRVQFTSDLLPADIIGVSIFNRESGSFNFHAGPIFSQVILADEVNRATPRTQSALLEAMEEHQVTTENETRSLPEPFFCHRNTKSDKSNWHLSITRITTGSIPDAYRNRLP